MIRKTLTVLAISAGLIIPAVPAHASGTPYCQYDVYQGLLAVASYRNLTGSVSALVTNNAGTASVILRGQLEPTDNGTTIYGYWSHGVYATYTDANAHVSVNGVNCESS